MLPSDDVAGVGLDTSHFVVESYRVLAFVMSGSTVIETRAQGNVGIVVGRTA